MSTRSKRSGQLTGYRPYMADFNGDGLADIMWDKGSSSSKLTSSGTRVLWTGTAAGSFSVTSNMAGQDGKLSGYVPMIADFDRDGRPDVFWYWLNSNGLATGTYAKWLNSGTGGFTLVSVLFPSTLDISDTQPSTADIDGDARTDIVWIKAKRAITSIVNPNGTFVDATLNVCSAVPEWDGCDMLSGTLDFNGDGLADILALDPDDDNGRIWALWRGQGNGSFSPASTGNSTSINNHEPYFIDINGDGNSDVFWDHVDDYGRSKGQRLLWLSKGDGTFIEQTNVSGQDGTLTGYRPYPIDFNGDGLADILWIEGTTDIVFGGITIPGIPLKGVRSGPSRVLWLGKGDGTFTVMPNFGGLDGTVVGFAPAMADFNGDGKPDILWDSRDQSFESKDTRSTGTRVLWLSDSVAPDLMTSVTTGVGASVSVTYKSMTDASVYSKDSTTPGGIVDVMDLQGALALVSKIDIANPIGGTLSTGYAYAGAKADLNGRGFLGFRQMTITDLQTNLVSTTTYRQHYPYTSLVAEETKKLGAVTLNSTVHTYGAKPLGDTRFQSFLVQSQAASADLDGSALPTVTSTYKYDTYGNATEIVMSAADGHSKSTVSAYANDTAKWLLGRLTRATVTSVLTAPAPPPAPPPTEAHVTLSYSTSSINLWSYLLANGLATSGTPGTWTVTIPSHVVIGGTPGTPPQPALDTGTFPAGSTLKIINNGTIVGVGGNGGGGGAMTYDLDGCYGTPSSPGADGGPALRAQVPVSIVNNGKIWGGGGGGGGIGEYYSEPGGQGYPIMGTGGGGGAGSPPGPAGGEMVCDESGCHSTKGNPGTLTSGGQPGGGSPGQAGAAGTQGYCSPSAPGGPPGAAVIGNSFITWQVVGDRKGPLN